MNWDQGNSISLLDGSWNNAGLLRKAFLIRNNNLVVFMAHASIGWRPRVWFGYSVGGAGGCDPPWCRGQKLSRNVFLHRACANQTWGGTILVWNWDGSLPSCPPDPKIYSVTWLRIPAVPCTSPPKKPGVKGRDTHTRTPSLRNGITRPAELTSGAGALQTGPPEKAMWKIGNFNFYLNPHPDTPTPPSKTTLSTPSTVLECRILSRNSRLSIKTFTIWLITFKAA